MRSAPRFGSFGGEKFEEEEKKESHLSESHPCLRKRAVSHHVFRVSSDHRLPTAGPSTGKDRCGVVVHRGNRRALAYSP